ncbi:MAG: B12-binding domain-containing protein [Actinomycetota bacterium]
MDLTGYFDEREQIASAVTDRFFQAHPEFHTRFGPTGSDYCRKDGTIHLTYLGEALRCGSPVLFAEYVDWTRTLFEGIGITTGDFRLYLADLRTVLAGWDAGWADTAAAYVGQGIETLDRQPAANQSFLDGDDPLLGLARSYLANLLALRRSEASRLIVEAAQSGTPVEDIYLRVFTPVLRELGRLWHTNVITVAQEHFCTAATQMAMSQLYPYIFSAAKRKGRFVGSCVSGELHELGLRMVSDLLELAGWDTIFLGANVPVGDIVTTLVDNQAQVLGVSATLTAHLGHASEIIRAVRAESRCDHVRILVGGAPFNMDPELWRRIGADAWAPSAKGAVELVDGWAA